MDTEEIISNYLAPVGRSRADKGIHKIALQARTRESFYRPPNPATRASFTLTYITDKVLTFVNPPDRVKVKIYRMLWNFQAYVRFLVVTNLGIIKTALLDPYRLFFHPLTSIAGLLFFFASQFIGLAIVVFVLFLRVTGLYEFIEKRREEVAGGYSLFNMGDPGMFTRYNENIEKAKRVFIKGTDYPPQLGDEDEDESTAVRTLESDLCGHRVKPFNLDVAKSCLLFSASMYERNEELVSSALLQLHANSPEDRIGDLVQAEQRIREIAHSWNVQFAGISDLNTYGGAYCGLWWDPHENWMVLSFKGTTPLCGGEWLSDITLDKTNAGAYLCGDVNKGFYDKLFPDYGAHIKYCPYGNILQTVKLAAKELTKEKVNLYVTGHSLGAAIATAFYCRAVKCPEDFGDNIKICNAYLFGAPRVGDIDFCAGFHSAVNQPFTNDQTLYRVMNGRDFVCSVPIGTGAAPTGQDYFFKASLFNYAHVGEAFRMNGGPVPTYVGSTMAPGVDVKMVEDENHYPTQERNGSSSLNIGGENGVAHVKFDLHHLSLKNAKKLITPQGAASVLDRLLPRIVGDHLPTRYMASLAKLNPAGRKPHRRVR